MAREEYHFEGDYEDSTTSLTILAGHPYFEWVTPSVYELPPGVFMVKWRHFDAVKDDAEFATLQEAERFAATLIEPPLTIIGNAEALAESDEFWRTLRRG